MLLIPTSNQPLPMHNFALKSLKAGALHQTLLRNLTILLYRANFNTPVLIQNWIRFCYFYLSTVCLKLLITFYQLFHFVWMTFNLVLHKTNIISISSPAAAQSALPPPCLSSWRTLPAHVWDQHSMPHPPQHFQASIWVDPTWTSLSSPSESLKTRTDRQKVRNLSLQSSSIIDEQMHTLAAKSSVTVQWNQLCWHLKHLARIIKHQITFKRHSFIARL